MKSVGDKTEPFGTNVGALNARERKQVNVIEMRCLRAISGVRWYDRRRNEEVRESFGERISLEERADRSVLRWYGHRERMGEERLVKKIHEANVEGIRARGRPRRKWKDGVVSALWNRCLSVQEDERIARDIVRWRQVVSRSNH